MAYINPKPGDVLEVVLYEPRFIPIGRKLQAMQPHQFVGDGQYKVLRNGKIFLRRPKGSLVRVVTQLVSEE